MKINTLSVAVILLFSGCVHSGQELESFPEIGQEEYRGGFTLAAEGSAATICIDTCDARVVTIAAGLLADDVERLTGFRPQIQTSESLPEGPAVIAVEQPSALHRYVRQPEYHPGIGGQMSRHCTKMLSTCSLDASFRKSRTFNTEASSSMTSVSADGRNG